MTTTARGTDRCRDELDLFSDARDSISSARRPNGAAIYMTSKETWRRAGRSPENSEATREKGRHRLPHAMASHGVRANLRVEHL